MKRIATAALLLCASAASAVTLEGTLCRMNRLADRLIIGSDSGARLLVALPVVPITFHSQAYDRADLRPGDRVQIIAGPRRGSVYFARSLEVTMRVDEALVDSIFRTHHTIVGRFAGRSGNGEAFSLHMPQRHFIRVDAAGASGPAGRFSIRSIAVSDLLEVRGKWVSKDLFHASSITVVTDREPSFCQNWARRDEIDAETSSREAHEQSFLDKADN